MAKIKVESQSTGTGIYTLKTGTASTNYSATLPDSTGTLSTEKLTTKGDLEVYGTAPDRLAVGTNDYLLTADSTAANGIAWKAAAGGGKILQVVTSGNNSATGLSTSWAEINGSSLTITPTAASSKILYAFNSGGYASEANDIFIRIERQVNSGAFSTIRANNRYGYQNVTGVHGSVPVAYYYIDTPTYSLTDTITYVVDMKIGNGTNSYINSNGGTNGNFGYAMEIGA